MEKFQTFEECCQALGIDPENSLPDVSALPKKHQKFITALSKLIIISEAVNQGWKPNWDDYNEFKYWPWFYMDAPGFRFDGSYYVYSYSNSAGGSRLCFKTREISNFVGNHYKDLWEDAMVIK